MWRALALALPIANGGTLTGVTGQRSDAAAAAAAATQCASSLRLHLHLSLSLSLSHYFFTSDSHRSPLLTCAGASLASGNAARTSHSPNWCAKTYAQTNANASECGVYVCMYVCVRKVNQARQKNQIKQITKTINLCHNAAIIIIIIKNNINSNNDYDDCAQQQNSWQSRALWRIISLQLSHVVADADVALSSSSTTTNSSRSRSSSDAGGSCGAAGGQHGLKANQRSKFSNSTFFEAELSTAE